MWASSGYWNSAARWGRRNGASNTLGAAAAARGSGQLSGLEEFVRVELLMSAMQHRQEVKHSYLAMLHRTYKWQRVSADFFFSRELFAHNFRKFRNFKKIWIFFADLDSWFWLIYFELPRIEISLFVMTSQKLYCWKILDSNPNVEIRGCCYIFI